MHRSGTSMMVEILEELGVFMGHSQDSNNEAHFFLEINQWLLSLTESSWLEFSDFALLMEDPLVLEKLSNYIKLFMSSTQIESFTGDLLYAKFKKNDLIWGWKDPRNTLTLPLWRKIFPECRVIHVYRNGLRVAESLVERSKKNRQTILDIISVWNQYDEKVQPPLSERTLRTYSMSLERGFGLWETYIQQAQYHSNNMSTDEYIEISYEDFTINPIESIHNLSIWLGLDNDNAQLTRAASKIRTNTSNKDAESEQHLPEFIKSSKYMRHYHYI